MSTALKIPKDKFLARLHEQLVLVEEDALNREKFDVEYKKAEQAYILKQLKAVIKDPRLIDYTHVNWSGQIQINLHAGDGWKRQEYVPKTFLKEWDVAEIKNIINLVSMAEGDYVPASLQKNAMRYL